MIPKLNVKRRISTVMIEFRLAQKYIFKNFKLLNKTLYNMTQYIIAVKCGNIKSYSNMTLPHHEQYQSYFTNLTYGQYSLLANLMNLEMLSTKRN